MVSAAPADTAARSRKSFVRQSFGESVRRRERGMLATPFPRILEKMIGKITRQPSSLCRESLLGCSRGCARGRATAIEAHRKTEGELGMRRIIAAFIADQTGATAIEYGLIAAGISIAIIVAVNNLGGTLNTTFTGVNTQLR
jgi:pilus assembly protein Flp/PilA